MQTIVETELCAFLQEIWGKEQIVVLHPLEKRHI